jgi:hypothetical protein
MGQLLPRPGDRHQEPPARSPRHHRYGAIVVPPASPVYTPQQLANRTVGVPFYFGTHDLALHLLEGFVPREAIRVCHVPRTTIPLEPTDRPSFTRQGRHR